MKANWEDSVRRDHVKSKLKVSSAMCQGKRLEKERKNEHIITSLRLVSHMITSSGSYDMK